MADYCSLLGKKALVTGGARGLGRAVAIALADAGADVVVHYNSRQGEAEETARSVRDRGRSADIIAADLGDSRAADAMVHKAADRLGGLDIVIGNAALPLFKPTLTIDDETLERVVRANVIGTYALLRAAAARIADGGVIIHVSTAGTRHPMPAEGLFAGVRAAGDMFAQCLAHELGPRGVRVNVVSPGAINTEGAQEVMAEAMELMKTMLPAGFDPSGPDPRAMASPFKRIAEPEEIADAIVAFCGPAGRWMTAQNLFLTGGAVSN